MTLALIFACLFVAFYICIWLADWFGEALPDVEAIEAGHLARARLVFPYVCWTTLVVWGLWLLG